MIVKINKIKNFGVFEDYATPDGMDTFAEKNIIYGWNYSGKTTLSRVFSCVEHHSVHQDYGDATFSFEQSDGSIITELDIASINMPVKVFNTDFIDHNLSWNGTSFNPILLLGEDSIDAEKKIEANLSVIDRCRNGFKVKKESVGEIENFVTLQKNKNS